MININMCDKCRNKLDKQHRMNAYIKINYKTNVNNVENPYWFICDV